MSSIDEQVGALHAQLEQARERVHERRDVEVRALHVAIAAGDRVIGQAQEHAAVVGDELAQLAQRGDRIGEAVEHVHERDEREASADADAEDLPRSSWRTSPTIDRDAERAAVRRGTRIDVEADRLAAELARAIARAPARGSRRRACAPGLPPIAFANEPLRELRG